MEAFLSLLSSEADRRGEDWVRQLIRSSPLRSPSPARPRRARRSRDRYSPSSPPASPPSPVVSKRRVPVRRAARSTGGRSSRVSSGRGAARTPPSSRILPGEYFDRDTASLDVWGSIPSSGPTVSGPHLGQGGIITQDRAFHSSGCSCAREGRFMGNSNAAGECPAPSGGGERGGFVQPLIGGARGELGFANVGQAGGPSTGGEVLSPGFQESGPRTFNSGPLCGGCHHGLSSGSISQGVGPSRSFSVPISPASAPPSLGSPPLFPVLSPQVYQGGLDGLVPTAMEDCGPRGVTPLARPAGAGASASQAARAAELSDGQEEVRAGPSGQGWNLRCHHQAASGGVGYEADVTGARPSSRAGAAAERQQSDGWL